MKMLFMLTGLVLAGTGWSQQKETRNVKDFSSLKVESAIEVQLTMGEKDEVVLEGRTEDLENVKVEVKEGELRLYCNDRTRTMKEVKAYITAKRLHEIEVSGASSVKLTNTLKTDKLDLEVSGAASLNLSLAVTQLKAEVSGAGKAELSGQANRLDAEISGAAGLDAENLKCDKVDIESGGASSARVSAKGTLKVNAAGASKIRYHGNPADKNISTSGAASVKAG